MDTSTLIYFDFHGFKSPPFYSFFAAPPAFLHWMNLTSPEIWAEGMSGKPRETESNSLPALYPEKIIANFVTGRVCGRKEAKINFAF
ncbi:hypothetical protein L1887_29879 [Cichorium endivia]|nr:hypothetical protein L1887_29879 [Cichorium endivia]